MNFKEWLIKEDPEEPVIRTRGEKHYAGKKEIEYPVKWNSHDALSFGVLKDFYLYSDSSMGLYHKDILNELWKMIKYPGQKIHTMDDNLAGDIQTHGTLNNEALRQIKDWIAAVEITRLKIDRYAALWYAPDFILGRIWTEQKVISFWNDENHINKHIDDIIEFIRLFGNPSDYMFEIKNRWKDYNSFIGKKPSKSSISVVFDPSKLHLLDPAIKGQVMRMSGVGSNSSRPGLKTRQSAFTSEATLYHGTRGQFDDLKPSRARFGLGVSYTTNPDIAFNYALGKYKGSKTSGEPIVKKKEYSGKPFKFFEKVPDEVVKGVLEQLIPYLEEFTPDKKRIFLNKIRGIWSVSGERFYREIQRAFAKKGTDEECKLAKSRNTNTEVCSKCSIFSEMPDLLNKMLKKLGYDALCYDDVNDGISHRCYFII